MIWGLFHGFFIVAERIGLDEILNRLWRPLRHLYLLFVVIIGWVFFRIEHFPDALDYLSVMFGLSEGSDTTHFLGRYFDLEVCTALIVGIIFSTFIPQETTNYMTEYLYNVEQIWNRISRVLYGLIRVVTVSLVFIISVVYLAAGTYNPFIYFRF